MSELRIGILGVALLAPLILAGLGNPAAAQPRAPEVNETAAGFYLGVFAGAAVLDSTVNFAGTTSETSTRVVDQGGDGAIFALRAGWGTLISQHVYLGAELELMLPANVSSRYSVGDVQYSARLENEVGAYARIGWSPNGFGLLFLRAGLGVPLSGDDSRVIPVIGAGAEVPIGRRFAGRVDIAYSFPSGRNDIESYRLTAGLVLRF